MEQIKTRLISTVYQVSLQITPALNRFCLVSPILASLSDDFCKLQGISTKYRTLHYQLAGDIQSRISENTKTLIKLMDQFEIGFVEEHDIVFNVISKAVLPPLFATEVINHTSIGHAAYQDFVSNRFHGNISVWSPMQKYNLKSFKANNKMIKKNLTTKLYSCMRRKIY